ncbi:MAG: cell division protein FtsI/penicillin-binding protein 2 [Planctomycetota bacterium]|jgi:cell division protein FtsI/penicillin-binding protein 2
MRAAELLRIRVAFGALGAVPIFLAGWLGWVQVAQAGTIDRRDGTPVPLTAATADRQGWKTETIPAPRGTIVDRNGATLATDRATYEVRARVSAPRLVRQDLTLFRPWVAKLVDRLARALVVDPDMERRDDFLVKYRKRLAAAANRAWGIDRLPETGVWPKNHSRTADFLVAVGVDRLAVTDALRSYSMSAAYPTLSMQFMHGFRRVYPDRELTHGIVGHLNSFKVDLPGGGFKHETVGVVGLESFAAMEPQAGGKRSYLADGRSQHYFVAPVQSPPEGAVMHSTLDLELQRTAVRELTAKCEEGLHDRAGKLAKWGALTLVEIATGDVLAAASWHRGGRPAQERPFAPYQSKFEPGSIVKPLVLSYALEVGALDWTHGYDCNPRHDTYRNVIRSLGRRKAVVDDHTCDVLTPHGIIVNSSNIGAALIGLQLSRPQWQDYILGYGFGQTLGLKIPGETRGGNHPRSFAPDITLRSFRANSAISFSFGYEMESTAMQVARAYLRMFRGLGAELRLVKALELNGKWHDVPVKQDTGPHYRPEVIDAVRQAMVEVVSNDPHATGRHVHQQMLTEKNVDIQGLVGGKTGTAVSPCRALDGSRVTMRNASFVGFLPADNPRWLAVCVLQSDVVSLFYGGRYAAPPAVKLLLQCQKQLERQSLHQESQFQPGGQTRHAPSGVDLRSPGSSGWNTPVGTDVSRDTR